MEMVLVMVSKRLANHIQCVFFLPPLDVEVDVVCIGCAGEDDEEPVLVLVGMGVVVGDTAAVADAVAATAAGSVAGDAAPPVCCRRAWTALTWHDDQRTTEQQCVRQTH